MFALGEVGVRLPTSGALMEVSEAEFSRLEAT